MSSACGLAFACPDRAFTPCPDKRTLSRKRRGRPMFRAPTLWKYTTREVQRRPGRTLLTLAGIVIGVATVVAITATTRASRRSYQEMYEAVGGKAALEVVARG